MDVSLLVQYIPHILTSPTRRDKRIVAPPVKIGSYYVVHVVVCLDSIMFGRDPEWSERETERDVNGCTMYEYNAHIRTRTQGRSS